MNDETAYPAQLHISELPVSKVDPKSPIPLYHQVNLDLRRMIEEKLIPPGSIIPPETEICRIYGVGRQTIRKAMAQLVDDNLIDRYAGKGTIIRDQTERTNFHLDRSFSQHVRDLGMQPHSILINQEEGQIHREIYPTLKEQEGRNFLKLERVRYGNQDPICYQSTIVLTQDCNGISGFDFNQESLYEVLANNFGLIITRIEHLIRAVAADDYRADLLKIPPGTPLLFVTTTAYLENGTIIEMTQSHYRADIFEYRTAEERMK